MFKIKRNKINREMKNAKLSEYDTSDPVVSLDKFKKILNPK